MGKRIGILIGREESWLSAFMQEINRRQAGVVAELIKLGGTRLEEPCEYQVIVDRISHQVPYYSTYLKSALLNGVRVINNPFWNGAIDGFFAASLATRLGILHPRTVTLPSHSYHPGLTQDALRNLVYPIPWQDHVAYLGGFPTVLRPVWHHPSGRLWKVFSYEDLWRAYNETGSEGMMLQEHIAGEKYIRCFCIGKSLMAVGYNPYAEWSLRYLQHHFHLTDEEREMIHSSADAMNQVLGYEVSAIDFVLKGQSLYLMAILNPAPDFDRFTLPLSLFDWIITTMADLVIAYAKEPEPEPELFRWSRLIGPSVLPPSPGGFPQEEQPLPEGKSAPVKKRATTKKAVEAVSPAPSLPEGSEVSEAVPDSLPPKTTRSHKKTVE